MRPWRGPARHRAWRSRIALFSLPFLLVWMTGCTHYVPIGPDRLDRGDPVRAVIAPRAVEVGDIAVRDAETVDGEFVQMDADRLYLSAMQITTRSGRKFEGLGHTVELERSAVQELMAKRIHVGRTLLFSGAIATGAVLLGLLVGGGESAGEGPPGNGGTQQ
ncbi:MAG: hypothetical protein ACN0LA_12820 [Candidatus Longimicrobiales bacterium M2_2A_002]